MIGTTFGILLALVLMLAGRPAAAEPIAVKYTEGLTRGFPVLRALSGERLAQGELIQIPRGGDVVESRLAFKFKDGSLYDERVVFSQRNVFTLLSYRIVQKGPSFPETVEAVVDRATGRYEVRYRGDEDSPEETLTGDFELPLDVYNGLLSTLLKNLPAGGSAMVQIVAFTPKPRLVTMLLAPSAEDPMQVNDAAIIATRFLIRPQLGLFASLLVADIPDVKCWIAGGEAPAFLRFEGPLYFMGPVWRIDWS
ncbi:MAG TPA: hypothetical protein VFV05_01865 [Methylomirabilota bacterium]|nr:hypothetical protein [Methylomirabilota bacterium]